MTLTLRVDGGLGESIPDQLLPEMVDLAGLTGCNIEMRTNDTLVVVRPGDTRAAVNDAYERLYPKSRMVCASMANPWPRDK